jgi:Matrixin/RTX calcium-binding nonapeptide repeat (4 copies)/FG-GAP-like repeat/Bacterial pre-peptidase C-terminal domain
MASADEFIVSNYVFQSGKWGASTNSALNGGVVTWSIAGAGLSGSLLFSGLTTSMATQFGFNYQQAIEQAFDAWAQVADIAFVQVQDTGGNIGTGVSGMMRLAVAASIDGPSNILAAALNPPTRGSYTAGPISGDIVFWTYQSFYLVALHEIGHALGLDHELTANSIMKPFYNGALYGTGPNGTALQIDDINGMSAKYGSVNAELRGLFMAPTQIALDALTTTSRVALIGNGLSNQITGSSRAETFLGGAGSDTIVAGAGDDIIFGDYKGEGASGIALSGSGSVTKNTATANNSIATALNLSGLFSVSSSANIENATTVPHVSVNGTGNGALDYYKLIINNAMSIITIDLDGGFADDMMVQLLKPDGTILDMNKDADSIYGAAGSLTPNDPYLNFLVANAGVYIVAIGIEGATPQPFSNTYTLHISVAGELVMNEDVDILTGGLGNDTIYGGGGEDLISGGEGNDIINGGTGDDSLDGGDGIDTIQFSGARTQYALLKSSGAFYSSDIFGTVGDGDDVTQSIERFQFSDVTLSAEYFTPVNFNSDLKSDILWCNTSGLAVNFLMNGTAITGAGAIGVANGSVWQVKSVGDLNGDGTSDLIWQDTSGLVVAYLMNGSAIGSAVVVGNMTAAFKVVGSGDLNGDGQSDIVVQDGSGQAIGLLMNGGAIIGSGAIGAANGAAWSVAAIGDLNGDGKVDLVWENANGSTVGYIMNGLAVTSAATIAGAQGSTWSVKGIGDLNGDGKGDIIWQYSNGQSGAWLMNGNTYVSGNIIGGANGSNVEIREIADLNGDGKMDLVWQDTTNGQAIGFLMNGTNITSAGLIGGANGADWFIV